MPHAEHDLDAATQQVCKYARLAYARQLAAGTGGNLSARCGDRAVVTPSGVSLMDLEPARLLVVDMAGKVVGDAGGHRPSKESAWHLTIMQQRPDVGGIVHLHCPSCVGAALVDENWPQITVTAAKYLRPAPVVPAAVPGSNELADGIVEAVRTAGEGANLVILAAHGIVALGSTIEDAFHVADMAEEAAKTAVIAMRRGL